MTLFSDQWMNKFMTEWNNEASLAKELAKIHFDSIIAYGFQDEENPRGVIHVKNGHIIKAGIYSNENNHWDLRAQKSTWKNWMKKEMSLMGIEAAYNTHKLQFANGDYKSMIKNPRLAAPFIKSFAVMGRV